MHQELQNLQRKLVKLWSISEKLLISRSKFVREKVPLPEFLIIGAPKAGTTWLWKNLSAHPEIYLPHNPDNPDPTEICYFDRNFYAPIRNYSKLFSGKHGFIKGDKSPNYYLLSMDRIETINMMLPDLRIILMLRNPVERAWSHAMMHFVRRQKRNLEEIPQSELLAYFDRHYLKGDYLSAIEKWQSVFQKKDMFIGLFDDISIRPKGLLSDIFSFLGAGAPNFWEGFPYSQVVNKGTRETIPAGYRTYLEDMYQVPMLKLNDFLEGEVQSWVESSSTI